MEESVCSLLWVCLLWQLLSSLTGSMFECLPAEFPRVPARKKIIKELVFIDRGGTSGYYRDEKREQKGAFYH